MSVTQRQFTEEINNAGACKCSPYVRKNTYFGHIKVPVILISDRNGNTYCPSLVKVIAKFGRNSECCGRVRSTIRADMIDLNSDGTAYINLRTG